MREAVGEQCLKTGIAQHDFEARAGGGVASDSRINLITQVFEEHRRHYVIVDTAIGLRLRAAASAGTGTSI